MFLFWWKQVSLFIFWFPSLSLVCFCFTFRQRTTNPVKKTETDLLLEIWYSSWNIQDFLWENSSSVWVAIPRSRKLWRHRRYNQRYMYSYWEMGKVERVIGRFSFSFYLFNHYNPVYHAYYNDKWARWQHIFHNWAASKGSSSLSHLSFIYIWHEDSRSSFQGKPQVCMDRMCVCVIWGSSFQLPTPYIMYKTGSLTSHSSKIKQVEVKRSWTVR